MSLHYGASASLKDYKAVDSNILRYLLNKCELANYYNDRNL